MKKVLALLTMLILPAVTLAGQLTQDQVDSLKVYQAGIRSINQLQSDGLLNEEQANHYRQEHLQLAGVIAKQPVPSTDVLDELIHQNDTSRFWGFFTFINIMKVFAGILLAIAITWLFVIYIGPILVKMPISFWEFAAYIFVLAGLFSGALWPVLGIWLVFPACLLLIGALSLTKFLHFEKSHNKDAAGLKAGKHIVWFSFTQFIAAACTVVWGTAALYYESYLIGFMTVVALDALLGFSVLVMPGCVGIGFEEDDAVPRATLASFIILVVYMLTTITGGFNPTSGEVSPLIYFRTGAIFMGAFVYYLGLLILASRYYNAKRGNYILLQILTIVSGVAAFYFGATFGINTLLGIGGTFFVLYLLEKYTELPWSDIGWAWALLGVSALLYGAGWVATQYPEYFLLGLK